MDVGNMLVSLSNKSEKLVIGLMSGTSADGIDAALVRIRGSGIHTELQLLAFETRPYSALVREEIHSLASAKQAPVNEISQLNFYLGEMFAEAAAVVASKAGIQLSEIDLIGSHGQTIRHLPREADFLGRKIASTWQIGEPSVIAKRTGVVTVADFRPADMAVGGQGAPLVPIFDYLIFRSKDLSRGLLNIGGIANLTILPKSCSIDEVIAFDTGPGNMLIDYLCRKHYNMPYDENGRIAATGKIRAEILALLLEDGYFMTAPPKSTGREYFGGDFLAHFEEFGRTFSLPTNDLIATATALTVQSIRQSYQRFLMAKTPIDQLIVSGGGSRNPVMMIQLREAFGEVAVHTSDDFGIPSAAKEAICFAVLANETVCGGYGNVPSATGAEKATVLGKICL